MDISRIISLIIYPFKMLFFYHKKKLGFFIFFLLLFAVVLFPYSDLTSFSKEKINQAMGKGASVDYSNISFNFMPFGIQTSEFSLSAKSLKQPLKIESITLRPDLFSLMRFQPGGSAVLNGFFSGGASINFSLDGKTGENTQKFRSSLNLDKLSLADLVEFQNIPIKLKGSAFGNLSISGEDSFREQPSGKFKFNMKNVVIPSSLSIPQMGEIPLPSKVVWSNSNLFGEIKKGKITIKEGTLGTKAAPLNGRYKGYINCSFSKSASGVKPACTDYSLKVELELSADFQRKLAADLKPLMNPRNVRIQTLPQGGAKYLFSVQGNVAQRFRPPRISSLNTFD